MHFPPEVSVGFAQMFFIFLLHQCLELFSIDESSQIRAELIRS